MTDILTALVEERTATHTFKDLLSLARALGATLNIISNHGDAFYETGIYVSVGERDITFTLSYKHVEQTLRYNYEILECLSLEQVKTDMCKLIQEVNRESQS